MLKDVNNDQIRLPKDKLLKLRQKAAKHGLAVNVIKTQVELDEVRFAVAAVEDPAMRGLIKLLELAEKQHGIVSQDEINAIIATEQSAENSKIP